MKNKHIKKLFLLLIFILIPTCLIFTGCGNNGKSAYEIAVRNGFTGTKEEWLTSLNGTNGKSAYEIAVENGFTGTEEEWLISLNGTSGKSAYEIAVENGFTGTEKEWLISLQGKNGIDGNNGKDGENIIDDVNTLYNKAKEYGLIDENMSYIEFLQQLYSKNNEINNHQISKNLFSVVAVYGYRNNNAGSSYNTAGSGVFYSIDDNGNAFIITNYHVIYNSTNRSYYPYFKISLYGQEENLIDAEVYGASRQYDLALLKVTESFILKSSNAQAATFNENPVSLGQICYAIGNTSTGTDKYILTATKGIVSVESEEISMTIGGISSKFREIRHDCYIFHGNSGGGLFDVNGNLIGITNGGIEGTLINYAIPVNIVLSVTKNLIKYKTDEAPSILNVHQIGIENNLFTQNVLSIYDSETSKIVILETLLIANIDQNSLINKSGKLAIGDEIISVTYFSSQNNTYTTYDNYNLRKFTLSELLIYAQSGDTITFKVNRKTVDGTITITDTITLSDDDIIKKDNKKY